MRFYILQINGLLSKGPRVKQIIVFMIYYTLVIEREKQFLEDCSSPKDKKKAINCYCRVLRRKQWITWQKAIEQYRNLDGFLLKQAIIRFIHELNDEANRSKTLKLMKLLKEYINDCVIRLSEK